MNVGSDSVTGADVFVPLNSLVPMADPSQFVIGGWDISKKDITAAMQRAQGML